MYVCVYAHTHTHCTDGVLGCEPRGREETPGGLKNPDGLNLGIYVLVYVYKAGMHQPLLVWHAPRGAAIVHMYIYMLRGGRRSWTNCFFLLYIFSSEKEKQKM